MPPITAPRAMVVTPHPLATATGVEALRHGGSAMDAAVARSIAQYSHAGGVDRFGEPIIEHVERVAAAVRPEARAVCGPLSSTRFRVCQAGEGREPVDSHE